MILGRGLLGVDGALGATVCCRMRGWLARWFWYCKYLSIGVSVEELGMANQT